MLPPAKQPNCLVVGDYKSDYRWTENNFQFPHKIAHGVWVLSREEVEIFWKLAGSLPVPTDPDWLLGNFVREGCLHFSTTGPSSKGNLYFNFSVSAPQNWHNVHMLIAYKQIFGVGVIAVSSGKTNSSSLVYRCGNTVEIEKHIQPVLAKLKVFATIKYREYKIFSKRIVLYNSRQKEKNFNRFTPMSPSRQKKQAALLKRYVQVGETVYLPEGWGGQLGTNIDKQLIQTPAIFSGYSIGDYCITVTLRKNSFVWGLAMFAEKKNRFILLQIAHSFTKIYGASRELANYTPAGVFDDQNRNILQSKQSNQHTKGVTQRYTSIERSLYWFRHFLNSPVHRAGAIEQLRIFKKQTELRIYCGSVNDYRLLSSFQRVFEPYIQRHESPQSRRIVALSIRKSLGLEMDKDQRALIPTTDRLVPVKPSPPLNELSSIFHNWKKNSILQVEQALDRHKSKKVKLTRKAFNKAESHQIFLSKFTFLDKLYLYILYFLCILSIFQGSSHSFVLYIYIFLNKSSYILCFLFFFVFIFSFYMDVLIVQRLEHRSSKSGMWVQFPLSTKMYIYLLNKKSG